jgi:uncharacterized membrane protein
MDLAPLHPIHVHFVIGFLVAGVLFRVAWLLGHFLMGGRMAFAGGGASALLLVGVLATYAAVESGQSAHGPVEDIPGAHDVVEEHEEWAEWTFRIYLVVALLEILALALARFGKAAPVLAASGLVGLVGLYFLYETGEHGGEVVYSYAGGVGTRSGDPKDVERLLLAGLYNQSVADRRAGRPQDAMRLVEMAAARWPQDLAVQLLLAESQLLDQKDATLATATLSRMQVPKEERRTRLRHGLLLADALLASGNRDAALAALQGLKAQFPDYRSIQERVVTLERSAAAPSAPGSNLSAASPAPTGAPVEGPSPSPAPNVAPSPSPSPGSDGGD